MKYFPFLDVTVLFIMTALLLVDSDRGVHGMSIPSPFHQHSKQTAGAPPTTTPLTISSTSRIGTTRRDEFLVAGSSSLFLVLPPPTGVTSPMLSTARAADLVQRVFGTG
jgi:hypothetical protein